MEAHLEQLERLGFTVVPSAIPAEQLLPLRAAFESVCDAIRGTKPPEHWSLEVRDADSTPPPPRPPMPACAAHAAFKRQWPWPPRAPVQAGNIMGAVEFFRACELSPLFEPLMDHPAVYPILAAALRRGRGGLPGEPRLRDPVAQHMPGRTQGVPWHRDGNSKGSNIRLTYILDELEQGGGGTACVAGSHLDRLRDRAEMLPLPPWFAANRLGKPEDAPVDPARPIVTPLAGMPAGSWCVGQRGPLCPPLFCVQSQAPSSTELALRCSMINWTAMIHRRTDNNTDSPRRTFWQVFCREGFDLGDRLCSHLSARYRAAQTIPSRIALVDDTAQRAAGGGFWRLEEIDGEHRTWPHHVGALARPVRRGAAL